MPGAIDFMSAILERTLPATQGIGMREEYDRREAYARALESYQTFTSADPATPQDPSFLAELARRFGQPEPTLSLAAAIPNLIERVMGTGPIQFPSSGAIVPTSPEMSPAMPEIQASEGIKQLAGGLLADAGVRLQPGFIKALEAVSVEDKPFGEGGGYYDPSEARIAVPGLIPSQAIGYPGPDYSEYPGNTGWVFIHEIVHRLDHMLPEDKNKQVWDEILKHFDKTGPKAAQWLRVTRAGKNPRRGGAEAFTDGILNYLFHHEEWSRTKMDELLSDYFKFEAVK